MTQAFYNSIGGISASQTQLVVVSDNIANMNTVGFKGSRVTFADVYYNTLQSGSPPTAEMGGTNPQQIGLGTKISSIDRDFTNGTVTSTGITTDCNIQGNGFFVVESATGEKYYTRAGNFTIDSEGYLSLPNGYRIVGATEQFSTASSTELLKIPNLIQSTTIANTVDLTQKDISDLNNCNIIEGTFSIKATLEDNAEISTTIDITGCKNLATIQSRIQEAMDNVFGTGACTVNINNGQLSITTDKAKDITYQIDQGAKNAITGATNDNLYKYFDGTKTSYVKIETDAIVDQKSYNPDGTETGTILDGTITADGANYIYIKDGISYTMTPIDKVENPQTIEKLTFNAGTSNFIETTDLTREGMTNVYSTNVLDYKQEIKSASSAEGSLQYSTVAIQDNGALEITYSNGDKLSVFNNENSKNEFKYTTSEGVIIMGNSDVIMDNNLLPSANLQIQLANFINPNGLIASGSNIFTVGSNSGSPIYGTGNSNSFGTIKTGGLEASNVDLSSQFADMIIAQRAIEANSRVFSTASSVMQTLVYLGQ